MDTSRMETCGVGDMFTAFTIYSNKFSAPVYVFFFFFFKKRDTLRGIPKSLQLWKRLCHMTLVGPDAWTRVYIDAWKF